MGLAEELQQSKSKAAEPAPAPAAETPAPEAPSAEEQLTQGFPTQKEVIEQVTQAEVTPEAQDNKETKITIGDKEFTNQEEAIKYAQELERQRIIEQAYKKGVLDAQPKDQKEQTPSIEEQIQDMLFENPAEALKLYRQEIEKEITSNINQTQSRQEQEKTMWTDFYESHADLANHRDLVEFVLEKNWNEIAHIDLENGLKKLAQNARKILSGYKEESKPRTELESKPAVVPGATGMPAPQPEAAPQKPLDFIAQVKKHRNRTLGEELQRLGIKK